MMDIGEEQEVFTIEPESVPAFEPEREEPDFEPVPEREREREREPELVPA